MKSFDQGSTQAHQELGKAFFKAVSLHHADMLMIPYTVGMFRDFDSAERIIHAGQKGVPDWIVFGKGFYLFFDVKTGKARFTTEQNNFKLRISQINGGTDHVYKLTSVEQGLNIIKNAKEFYVKG